MTKLGVFESVSKVDDEWDGEMALLFFYVFFCCFLLFLYLFLCLVVLSM